MHTKVIKEWGISNRYLLYIFYIPDLGIINEIIV